MVTGRQSSRELSAIHKTRHQTFRVMISRRDVLKLPGLLGLAPLAALGRDVAQSEHKIDIAPVTLDLSPHHRVKTTAYNGQVPGPLLRLKEGMPVTIDVTNASHHEDIVHWHGVANDTANDGSVEQGSSLIGVGKTFRYHFAPKPAGTRWYHTHAMAMGDLSRATYTGQFGFLLVEEIGRASCRERV